jgi:acetyl esterase/lipase
MSRSPLGWLDLVVPKDRRSRQLLSAVPFGPHPMQKLDLYAPREGKGPWPLMVFIYGGGWEDGTREDYHFAGRAMAGMGFLTVVCDYRVHPEAHFPVFLEDCALAANWLLDHAAEHGGDPGRVVLAGHSAGAYNAVMLALQPARFGAPRLAGRIEAVVGLSGPYDFYPYDVRQSINAFGQYAEPLTTQPINLVTPEAPPMLLIQGVKDVTVGDYHTVRLADKLRQAGVPVVETHYPTYGHAQTVLGLMPVFRWFWPIYGAVRDYLRGR